MIRNILTGFLSILLTSQFACTHAGPHSTEPVKIENQGVKIDYRDTKTGDTALIFIHGWSINQSYWKHQVAFFAKKYRVITLDLPGFGQSGKNRSSWTVEDYGKDISALIAGLNLKNVILIGHSMSGAIAVETALTNPDRVIGVVGVDNFKKYGEVETEESKAATAVFFKAARSNYKTLVTGFVNQYLFSPSTDSLIRSSVLSDVIHCDSIISLESLEQNGYYPLDDRVKSLHKTLYMINSSLRPTDTLSFQQNSIPYVLYDIGPTGHYPMLEKPDDFNQLLEEVLKKMRK